MKLDNDHIMKLLGFISDGMTKESACIAVKISTTTYYAWLKQGKEDEKQGITSLQRQLAEDLPQAEALCELECLKIIKAAQQRIRQHSWKVQVDPASFLREDALLQWAYTSGSLY